MAKHPNSGRASYWASVVGPDRPLVCVIDDSVGLPASTRSLEFRAPGLWSDHNCETPLEHWSLALEAFGVALDDPRAAWGRMLGDRTALGFDLEWETVGAPVPNSGTFESTAGYELACRVHGEVLVGHERLPIDATGWRTHTWGPQDWSAFGWHWAGWQDTAGRPHRAAAPTAAPTAPPTGPVRPLASGELPEFEVMRRAGDGEAQDAVTSVTAEPVAWSAVLVDQPGLGASRVARAMATFTEVSGSGSAVGTGVGWIELNEPQV